MVVDLSLQPLLGGGVGGHLVSLDGGWFARNRLFGP
jgi:hypothetical protein